MKNQVKYLQNLFYEILNDYGRVYLVLKYSEKSSLGRRGFSEEEKNKGLILVFNDKNNKGLQWTDDGSIFVTLGFGMSNRPENCFIHCDDIVSIYSPDAKVKFDRWDMLDIIETVKTETNESSEEEKVIPFDKFKKKKTL
jgi:hypothetical protein